MEYVEVSAKETGNGVFRITQNGRVIGDSRGFDEAQANMMIDDHVRTLRSYRYPYDAVPKYIELAP